MSWKTPSLPSGEICILAGGLSERMGRDKKQLRLGNRSLLSHVRIAAKASGMPVRVIRRDLVPRSGPLGGIFTALKTTHADAVFFLACDMPFVSPELIQRLVAEFSKTKYAVFTQSRGAGFPFVIPCSDLSAVEKLLTRNKFSLQGLAKHLRAKSFLVGADEEWRLFNVNTPEEWQEARRMARELK